MAGEPLVAKVPAGATPLLVWEKQSHWRYRSVFGGAGYGTAMTIEVVKRPYGHANGRVWTVGTVFGVEHHDWRNQGPHSNGHDSLTGAQLAAEALAKLMLERASAFLEIREEAGGPPRHGRPRRA